MRGKYKNKRDARLATPNPSSFAEKLAAVFALVDLGEWASRPSPFETVNLEEWKQVNEQAAAATLAYLATTWPAIIDQYADESDDEDDDVHIYLSRYLRFHSADWFGADAPMDVREVIERFFTEDEYRWFG